MIKDADVEAQQAAHTTDSGRPCASEKALRSCCQNALVMGVAFLREQQHKLILKIITCTIQPLEDWHGEQNQTCEMPLPLPLGCCLRSRATT